MVTKRFIPNHDIVLSSGVFLRRGSLTVQDLSDEEYEFIAPFIREERTSPKVEKDIKPEVAPIPAPKRAKKKAVKDELD